jgi:lipopolysaccharide export system permease protein
MIQRSLVREVALPFLAWTGLLCALLFVTTFLKGSEVLLGSAVTPWDFARFLLYLSPQFLVQALPSAFLLALQLGLGRLAEDGELGALQALGVSPATLARGPLAMGAALSVLLAVLMSTAQPWGQLRVRLTANDIIRRNLMQDLKPGVLHEEVQGFTVFAGAIEPSGAWRQVMLHDERDPERPLLVLAARGGVRVSGGDDGLDFELEQGVIHRAAPSGGDDYATLAFRQATLRAGLGEAYLQKNQFHTAREEQTPAELLEAAREAEGRQESPRPWLVTLHWRLGQMLMPLSFAALGTPLAMGRRRGGRGLGVLLTLLGYLGFYVLARLAVQLADAGSLPPALAGQLPNLAFIGAGLLLLRASARRGVA